MKESIPSVVLYRSQSNCSPLKPPGSVTRCPTPTYIQFSRKSRIRVDGPTEFQNQLAYQKLQNFGYFRSSTLLLIGYNRLSTRWLRQPEPSSLAELIVSTASTLRFLTLNIGDPIPWSWSCLATANLTLYYNSELLLTRGKNWNWAIYSKADNNLQIYRRLLSPPPLLKIDLVKRLSFSLFCTVLWKIWLRI